MLLNVCLQNGPTLIHNELCIKREKCFKFSPNLCLNQYFFEISLKSSVFLEGWAETFKCSFLCINILSSWILLNFKFFQKVEYFSFFSNMRCKYWPWLILKATNSLPYLLHHYCCNCHVYIGYYIIYLNKHY